MLMSSFATCCNRVLSQASNEIYPGKVTGRANAFTKNNTPPKDSIIFIKSACKNFSISALHYEFAEPEKVNQIVTVDKTPFITVHGNILYNFSYRSYIDTPFAQSDVMQHLVQTNLNFLVKGKYPVRMTLSNRSSNSPYFKNATDVNFEFNRYQLLNNIKADLRNKVTTLVNTQNLNKAEDLYKAELNKAQGLQAWLSSPARAQEMVEEKERQLRGNAPALSQSKNINDDLKNEWLGKTGFNDFSKGNVLKEKKGAPQGFWEKIQKEETVSKNKLTGRSDSIMLLAIDSLQTLTKDKTPGKDSSRLEKFNAKRQELVKLQTELKQQETTIRKEKKNVQDSITRIRQEINSLNSSTGLYAFMKRNHISKDSLTRGQRLLLSINKIGIGRSWVDYSELTVKNISLTGVNIEMNPAPYYIAFAAGKLNYRFRDFILKDNRTLPNQSLYLLRAGIGKKEKNNLIFTFYNGKKEVLNNTSSALPSSMQRVLGVSAEARITLDPNNYVIGELAKSSYGNNASPQASQSALLDKAFNWKIHTNEAYSVKLFSQYPQTDTRVTAFYRKTGENFQSFNLYPIGSNQEAWMARVNQSFYKRKLTIDAAIRKNDFVSPIAAPSFDSKTIFKSLQATLRIPKYPFISVGYYPSSQLSLSNNNVLTESQYNTFNTIISHSYSVKSIAMNTNAVYTKFYNSSSDSGFIYYNASSYTINHSFFLHALTLQSSISLTDQKDLHLFTTEQLVGYQFKNKLTLSGSLKCSRLNKTENLFGGTAALGMNIKKLGTFQLNYDKTYLPGYNRVLMPVDMGRMSFYREF